MSGQLIAAEIWLRDEWEEKTDGGCAVVACVRFSTGVYRVFTGGELTPAHDRNVGVAPALDLLALSDFLKAATPPKGKRLQNPTLPSMDWIEHTVGLVPASTEFSIEKAAFKYARRLLTAMTRAAKTDIGWEPKPGWRRDYDGPLTVQAWNVNARRDKKVKEIENLEESIQQDDNNQEPRFAESDGDFASRRRRKLELRRRKLELEQQL